MNRLLTKHLFFLITAASLFVYTIFFNGCRLYFEDNQHTVNELSAKTKMQAFDQLDNPIVMTLPVRKHLNLLGNAQWDYTTETVGNVFVVYDTSTDSLYDWAFFEGRNCKTSWSFADTCADGQYYVSSFWDGHSDKYRIAYLDKGNGTISQVKKYPYYGDWITKNHLINDNYNYLPDNAGYEYSLKCVDLNTFAENELYLESEKYISFDVFNEKLYMQTESKNEVHISFLSDDASKFEDVLYFPFEGKKSFYIKSIDDNYVILLCYDYLNEDDSEKYFYIFDLKDVQSDGLISPKGIFLIRNYNYWVNCFIYKGEVYFLYETYDENYTNTTLTLYKASFENTHLEEITSFKRENEYSFYSIKLIGSKLYLIRSINEDEVPSYRWEGFYIQYLDMENLSLSEGKIFTSEKLSKEGK